MPEISYHKLSEERIEAAVVMSSTIRGLGRLQIRGADILADLDMRVLSFSPSACEHRLRRRLAKRQQCA